MPTGQGSSPRIEAAERLAAPLSAALARRGATLVRQQRPDAAGAVLDPLATRLLRDHEAIRRLLGVLRWSGSTGRSATLRLAPGDEGVTAVTGTCAALHRLGLLDVYQYNRSRGTVFVRAANAADGFLAGGWLERAVSATVLRTLLDAVAAGAKGPVGFARGAEVRLPGDRYAELDVLALLGDRMLWIECRAGRVQERLPRYASLRAALGVPPERALTLGLGLEPELAATLSELHGLRVIAPAALAAATTGALGLAPTTPLTSSADVSPRAPDRGGSTPPDPLQERIATELRRARLRPHAEIRERVLAQVGPALASLEHPPKLAGLSRTCAARAGTPSGLTGEIVLAVLRGGALLDSDNQPVRSTDEPIVAARSPDELEDACQRAYSSAIRAGDADLLATDTGERALAAVTGGRA